MIAYTLLMQLAMCAHGFKLIPARASLRTPLHMAMSAEFSAADFTIVREAADAWNAAIDTTVLEIWDAGAQWHANTIALDGGASGNVMLHAVYSSPARQWIVLNISMTISRKLWGNALYNTALHEFGHVLGLDHSSDSRIMGSVLLLDTDGFPLPTGRITISRDDVNGVAAGQQ